MLAAQKISVEFGGTRLLKEVNFQVNSGDRMGLIGKNGAGKSTLLKLLAGVNKPTGGLVTRAQGASVGYLPQELPLKDGKTVWEETESALVEIKQLEAMLDQYNHQLSTRTDYESDGYLKVIEDMTHAQERFQLIGGYTYAARLELVLMGLGFKREDFPRPTKEFSGGWRMRVELAKLLVQQHDYLLLDEPTNHLDIESILWLEEWMVNFPGGVVLVSHDKTFLDNVTNRTLELSYGRSFDMPLPYSKFLVAREEQIELQRQAAKNQEKEIKQTEELIERFRAKASKASFAQSLIKKLEKIDRIEVDGREVRNMKFRFPPAPRSGKVVLLATDLGKSFDNHQVLKKVNLEVERGQRVAFVGQNGQGKSTLLKCVLNVWEHSGSVELGHNVKVGYYAQDQADRLDGEKTLLQTIEEVAPDEIRPRSRDLLGTFLFSGEDVDKKVKVLSGGEKGRLALCLLMLEPVNLLIMDEPTNHLDLQAKAVLKQALINFDGSLLVVSHDRDFLEGLTQKIFEVKDGGVKEHIGDIVSFLESRKSQDIRSFEQGPSASPTPQEPKQKSNKEDQKLDREREKETLRLKRQLEKLEGEIAVLEQVIGDLDARLADPDEFLKISKEPGFYAAYEQQKEQLEKKMDEWAKLEEALSK